MKYIIENGYIEEEDIIEDGYKYRRKVEDLWMYRKEDKVLIARKHNEGELEVLLNLRVKEERK